MIARTLTVSFVALSGICLPAHAETVRLTVYDDGFSCPGDCDAHVSAGKTGKLLLPGASRLSRPRFDIEYELRKKDGYAGPAPCGVGKAASAAIHARNAAIFGFTRRSGRQTAK